MCYIPCTMGGGFDIVVINNKPIFDITHHDAGYNSHAQMPAGGL